MWSFEGIKEYILSNPKKTALYVLGIVLIIAGSILLYIYVLSPMSKQGAADKLANETAQAATKKIDTANIVAADADKLAIEAATSNDPATEAAAQEAAEAAAIAAKEAQAAIDAAAAAKIAADKAAKEAEATRIADEEAAKKAAADAEAARKAEDQRLAELAAMEAERLAQEAHEQQLAYEEQLRLDKLAAEAAEKDRLAKIAAEEARLEAIRQEELAAQAEAQRLADEEAARLAKIEAENAARLASLVPSIHSGYNFFQGRSYAPGRYDVAGNPYNSTTFVAKCKELRDANPYSGCVGAVTGNGIDYWLKGVASGVVDYSSAQWDTQPAWGPNGGTHFINTLTPTF